MRLALSLSALFVISAMVAGAVAWVVMGDELRSRLYDDARMQAQALAVELETGGAGDLVRQVAVVSAFGGDQGTLVFFLPNEDGKGIGSMRLADLFEGPRQLIAGRDMVLHPDPGEQEGEVYFAWGMKTPQGWIAIARDSQWIADSQEVLIQSIAWGLGVAMFATVILAIGVGRRDARRVERIRQVLDKVASGDFAARYPEDEKKKDDLSQVAVGINRMLARLESNVERLAQVSADIAHDLRSPLTRLRLRLEPQALRDDLPDDARAAIGASLESLAAISAGFDAILQLSQIETGNMALEAHPVDLRPIVQDVYEMLQPIAEDSGHSLELALPPTPVLASVNAELISQALVNLADNALRYTPPGTEIGIETVQVQGSIHITVCDNGPGIPTGERENVTRRFYRLDRSRNRQGTGLGLSLVAAIAKLHGGWLSLTDNDPGLCAMITLPESTSGGNSLG